MNGKLTWQLDATQGRFVVSLQHDIVLQPTTFALTFDSVELMYCQMLNARVKAKQDAQRRVLT